MRRPVSASIAADGGEDDEDARPSVPLGATAARAAADEKPVFIMRLWSYQP